jgi:hypothetical protein
MQALLRSIQNENLKINISKQVGHCDVPKSVSLNLEPSGPVQACTGIAFITFLWFPGGKNTLNI